MIDAQNFYDNGLEQLNMYALRGEHQAKVGLLAAIAADVNIVLIGEPGSGKSVLAGDSYHLIDGIDREDVVEIPALADITPQQIVGGEVRIEKTIGDTRESIVTNITPLINPGAKVLWTDEINRLAPHALNSMLSALETRVVISTAGDVPVSDLQYVVSGMNPDTSGGAKFPIDSAIASRYSIGVVMDRDTDGDDAALLDIIKGWKPQTGKIEAVTDIPTLNAIRKHIDEGVGFPESLQLEAVQIVKSMKTAFKEEARTGHAKGRLAAQLPKLAKTLAALRGESGVTRENLHEAVRFMVGAKIGMLSMSTMAQVDTVAARVLGD